MAWRIEYADYAGNPYGEVLDAHDRIFNFNLQSPNTATMRLNLVNNLSSTILTNKEGLLLIYRNKTLAMTAEVVSVETSGDDQEHSITVVAQETMYPRLNNRLVGKGPAGLVGPTSATDQGQWLSDQLDAVNATAPTGLRFGSITPSGTISGGTWRFKPYMELMAELAATTNGFDFYQRPKDPTNFFSLGITGAIDVAPIIGNWKPNVVFDYGGLAANARSYQWIVDNTNTINVGYVLPPSYPDSAGLKIASVTDAGSVAARGRREQVIPSDLNDFTLRSQLASLHVALRKAPREQFIIQPANTDGTKRVPQFLVDYNVGDTVRGRVTDQNLLMLDAMVRVYGVTVSLDDDGAEVVDLNLINDGIQTAQ